MESLQQRCRRIEVLVVDVDGVLTAGGIVLGNADEELKQFHVRDGYGLRCWHRVGKVSAIITGRDSKLVVRRAAEVGIVHVYQNAGEKLLALQDLRTRINVTAEQIAYVGDDVPDVPCLREVGLAVAVADACPEALAAAHYITTAPGGTGAVRETIERILRCQGLWVSGERGVSAS
jgi:3-deoxy-D-manno-octulosonate 8-phosphate phosphatase (KDO 8-P phosphatase)